MVLQCYCFPACDASEGDDGLGRPLVRILAPILRLAYCQGYYMRPNKRAFTSLGFGLFVDTPIKTVKIPNEGRLAP